MRRVAAIVSVAALGLAAVGCFGTADDNGSGPKTLTVYVSVPLHGPRAAEGKAIADGARVALALTSGRVDAVRVRGIYLDDTEGGDWTLAQAGANARRAVEDSSSIGYIGDLDSGATKASLPITNQAQLLQISPGSPAVDLTRLSPNGGGDPDRYQPGDRTFARLVPDDEVQARAAAAWAKRLGAKRVAALGGSGPAQEFKRAAADLGLTVGSPADADLVYVGGAGRGLAGVGAKDVIASDALGPAILGAVGRSAASLYVTSPYIDPAQLPARGKLFVRSYRQYFGVAPRPAAAYGFEAMNLLLNAIHSDGDSRGAVTDAVLATRNFDSVLGTFSIDGNGDTTLDTLSGYRIEDGLPVFPVKLTAPR